jgi:large subunit ribosomal protein L1
MTTHGKKYREAAAAIEDGKFYPPAEAMSLVRQISKTTFDSSIEAHIRLGIDPRHADQVVRSTVTLPHGTGKVRRIAVFATGEKLREAIEAGADVVGGEDLVKKVQEGVIDFDVALATPREDPRAAWTDAEPQSRHGDLRYRQGDPGCPGWPRRVPK